MDYAQQLEKDAMALVEPIERATEPGDSPIQRFYDNATIFITGGSGFLGRQLLEKLFRSCNIKKAFVLLRPKRDKTAEERIQALVEDAVFQPARCKKPDLRDRLVCVAGDVKLLRLGLSEHDWTHITQEVDIIFHLAATIRFDEAIREATLINVRGTREILTLAKACTKLKSFVHVSTAYCNATTTRTGFSVLERYYPSPVPAETLLQIADTLDEERLNAMTPSLISGWPNTYTFTKAIAEGLVQAEVGNLPVCIVRPSIVVSSYIEPLPGWLDKTCAYGPSGILLGVGVGVIRIVHVNNTLKLSFVPLDYVNNATIAAAWDAAVRREDDDKIYHVSTTSCSVTFKSVSGPMKSTKIRNICTNKCIWYCYNFEVSNKTLYRVLSWFLHYIPAYIVDAAMKIFRIRKPKGLKSFVYVYTKYEKFMQVFNYFLTNEWNFTDTNLQNLRLRMSESDRTIFNFDMKSIDWNHYSLVWCLGVRKYIVEDGLRGTAEGVRKQKWLKVANYGVLMLYIYIFWKILCLLMYVTSFVF